MNVQWVTWSGYQIWCFEVCICGNSAIPDHHHALMVYLSVGMALSPIASLFPSFWHLIHPSRGEWQQSE